MIMGEGRGRKMREGEMREGRGRGRRGLESKTPRLGSTLYTTRSHTVTIVIQLDYGPLWFCGHS